MNCQNDFEQVAAVVDEVADDRHKMTPVSADEAMLTRPRQAVG
jgi:hypothetical protein